MTKRNVRSPHVVAYDGTTAHGKLPYTLECRRCGETLSLRLPVSVTSFAATSKSFERAHRDCEAPVLAGDEVK